MIQILGVEQEKYYNVIKLYLFLKHLWPLGHIKNGSKGLRNIIIEVIKKLTVKLIPKLQPHQVSQHRGSSPFFVEFLYLYNFVKKRTSIEFKSAIKKIKKKKLNFLSITIQFSIDKYGYKYSSHRTLVARYNEK